VAPIVADSRAKASYFVSNCVRACQYVPSREALTQGNASALGAGGRTFKSCRPDHKSASRLAGRFCTLKNRGKKSVAARILPLKFQVAERPLLASLRLRSRGSVSCCLLAVGSPGTATIPQDADGSSPTRCRCRNRPRASTAISTGLLAVPKDEWDCDQIRRLTVRAASRWRNDMTKGGTYWNDRLVLDALWSQDLPFGGSVLVGRFFAGGFFAVDATPLKAGSLNQFPCNENSSQGNDCTANCLMTLDCHEDARDGLLKSTFLRPAIDLGSLWRI